MHQVRLPPWPAAPSPPAASHFGRQPYRPPAVSPPQPVVKSTHMSTFIFSRIIIKFMGKNLFFAACRCAMGRICAHTAYLPGKKGESPMNSLSRLPKEALQIRFGDCYARDAGVPLMGRHGMERAGSERRFQIRQYHESGAAIGF